MRCSNLSCWAAGGRELNTRGRDAKPDGVLRLRFGSFLLIEMFVQCTKSDRLVRPNQKTSTIRQVRRPRPLPLPSPNTNTQNRDNRRIHFRSVPLPKQFELKKRSYHTMSSPCIDLDMNLLSSPDPPESAASLGRIDDHHDHGTMDDSRFESDNLHTPDHSVMQASSLDQYRTPIAFNSTDNIEIDNKDNGTERGGHSCCDDLLGCDNSSAIATQQQQDHAAMTQLQLVASWREELYMMNVENSILLDDLVKLGADV